MAGQRADDQFAFPDGEPILFDADQIRYAYRGNPRKRRLLITVMATLVVAEGPPGGSVVRAVGDERPAIVGPLHQQVQLIAALGSVLRAPDSALGSHVQALRIAMSHREHFAASVIQVDDEALAVGHRRILREHLLGLDAGEVMITEREHEPMLIQEPQSATNLHSRERVVLVNAVLTSQRQTGRGLEYRVPVKIRRPRQKRVPRAAHGRDADDETLLLALPVVMRNEHPDPLALLLHADIGDSELPPLDTLQLVGSFGVRPAGVSAGVGVGNEFLRVGRHLEGQWLDREIVTFAAQVEDVHAAVAGGQQVTIADQGNPTAPYDSAGNSVVIDSSSESVESCWYVGYSLLHRRRPLR